MAETTDGRQYRIVVEYERVSVSTFFELLLVSPCRDVMETAILG